MKTVILLICVLLFYSANANAFDIDNFDPDDIESVQYSAR